MCKDENEGARVDTDTDTNTNPTKREGATHIKTMADNRVVTNAPNVLCPSLTNTDTGTDTRTDTNIHSYQGTLRKFSKRLEL